MMRAFKPRPPMLSNKIVPLFTSDKFAETREFYCNLLGFEAFMDNETYLGLRLAGGELELGFLPVVEEHPLSSGAGLVYRLESDDLDAEYEALKAKGAPLWGPPETMPWGDRRMCMPDPNGITIYIGERRKL